MIVASVVMLLVIATTAHCVVGAVEEGWNLSLSNLSKRIWEVITSLLMLGLVFALSKCSCTFNEKYSPNRESTMEHYEPR